MSGPPRTRDIVMACALCAGFGLIIYALADALHTLAASALISLP